MSIKDRMFARVGEMVELQTRVDAPSATGGLTETYTTFATVVAKVVELGSMHLGTEQVEEGVTHLVTVSEDTGVNDAEYVIYQGRRLRVSRQRLIGPADIRFRQLFCEEIESDGVSNRYFRR
jgi:head-tail adaptor